MALGKDYTGQACSLASSLELLGERWTLLVVRDAIYGVRRFNDFLTRLDCPKAVLAERLKVLVAAGVLEKRRYSDSPQRYEYVLTRVGQELWPVIYHLGAWSQRHQAIAPQRLFRHADCAERLDGPLACSKCGPIDLGDIKMLPGPAAVRTDPVSQSLNRPRRLLEPLAVQ